MQSFAIKKEKLKENKLHSSEHQIEKARCVAKSIHKISFSNKIVIVYTLGEKIRK